MTSESSAIYSWSEPYVHVSQRENFSGEKEVYGKGRDYSLAERLFVLVIGSRV
jgi:hypothetical protein